VDPDAGLAGSALALTDPGSRHVVPGRIGNVAVCRSETDDMHRHRMTQREEHLERFGSLLRMSSADQPKRWLLMSRNVSVQVLILTLVATRRALIFFTSRLTAIRARLRRSLLRVLFSVHPLRCSALG
jgi:hypothetical protein